MPCHPSVSFELTCLHHHCDKKKHCQQKAGDGDDIYVLPGLVDKDDDCDRCGCWDGVDQPGRGGRDGHQCTGGVAGDHHHDDVVSTLAMCYRQ